MNSADERVQALVEDLTEHAELRPAEAEIRAREVLALEDIRDALVEIRDARKKAVAALVHGDISSAREGRGEPEHSYSRVTNSPNKQVRSVAGSTDKRTAINSTDEQADGLAKAAALHEYLSKAGKSRWKGVSREEHKKISSKGGKTCHANRRKAKMGAEKAAKG